MKYWRYAVVAVASALAGGAAGWYLGSARDERFAIYQSGPNGINLMRLDRRTGRTWDLDIKTDRWYEVP